MLFVQDSAYSLDPLNGFTHVCSHTHVPVGIVSSSEASGSSIVTIFLAGNVVVGHTNTLYLIVHISHGSKVGIVHIISPVAPSTGELLVGTELEIVHVSTNHSGKRSVIITSVPVITHHSFANVRIYSRVSHIS